MVVYPYYTVSKNAIKRYRYMFTKIGSRDNKSFTVPAHTGFREVAADSLRSMACGTLGAKWLFNSPVMRKINLTPSPVIKLCRGGTVPISCFSQVRETTCAIVKIFR